MDIATRHKSAVTAWPSVLHVGLLSASTTRVPALTNCNSVRVALRTEPSGRNCRHLSSKAVVVRMLRVAAREDHKAIPKRLDSGLILACLVRCSNERFSFSSLIGTNGFSILKTCESSPFYAGSFFIPHLCCPQLGKGMGRPRTMVISSPPSLSQRGTGPVCPDAGPWANQ